MQGGQRALAYFPAGRQVRQHTLARLHICANDRRAAKYIFFCEHYSCEHFVCSQSTCSQYEKYKKLELLPISQRKIQREPGWFFKNNIQYNGTGHHEYSFVSLHIIKKKHYF
jgi:hypothetical protein